MIENPNHEPLWALFRKHGGSIRVIAAAASVLGLTDTDCLPRPLQLLSAGDIADIARVITALELKYPIQQCIH